MDECMKVCFPMTTLHSTLNLKLITHAAWIVGQMSPKGAGRLGNLLPVLIENLVGESKLISFIYVFVCWAF